MQSFFKDGVPKKKKNNHGICRDHNKIDDRFSGFAFLQFFLLGIFGAKEYSLRFK